jgi:hypothetical protein
LRASSVNPCCGTKVLVQHDREIALLGQFDEILRSGGSLKVRHRLSLTLCFGRFTAPANSLYVKRRPHASARLAPPSASPFFILGSFVAEPSSIGDAIQLSHNPLKTVAQDHQYGWPSENRVLVLCRAAKFAPATKMRKPRTCLIEYPRNPNNLKDHLAANFVCVLFFRAIHAPSRPIRHTHAQRKTGGKTRGQRP